MGDWFYRQKGLDKGPITEEEVVELYKTGAIKDYSFILKSGSNEWKKITEYEEFKKDVRNDNYSTPDPDPQVVYEVDPQVVDELLKSYKGKYDYIDKNLLNHEKIIFKASRHWLSVAIRRISSAVCIYLFILSPIIKSDFSFLSDSSFDKYFMKFASYFVGTASASVIAFIVPIIGYILFLFVVFDALNTFALGLTDKRVIGKTSFFRGEGFELHFKEVEGIKVTESYMNYAYFDFGKIEITTNDGDTKTITGVAKPTIFIDKFHKAKGIWQESTTS